MQFHPVAKLFPLMSSEEFKEFCADIKANGLREPIWTHEQQIVDGRNRFNACIETGIEPRYREWNGEGSLTAFVVSLNLKRRHLSESQRAMVAGKLANMDRGYTNTSIDVLVSQSDAAKLLNVSLASVSRAARIVRDGVSELAEKVEMGEISVSQASQIAGLPKGKQKRLIKRGRKSTKQIITRLKIKSLRNTQDGYVSCLHCNPYAQFNPDIISAFMQKLEFKATEFARQKKTTNYGPVFEGVVLEIEEIKVAEQIQPHIEKILAAIDRGTIDGEKGLAEKGDIRKITKIPNLEFNQALAHMLDYKIISMCHMEGKSDAARGSRKEMFRRFEQSNKTNLTYQSDDGFNDVEDVYYDRDDDYDPFPFPVRAAA